MSFINGKSLGILGGGQLAKMLAQSAQKMGLNVYIYSENTNDPAASVTSFHTKGKFTDLKRIEVWSKKCDMVTFESEFLDITKVKTRNIEPKPKVMTLLRDRLSQKNLLEKFKIPTSPFEQISVDSGFSKASVLKQRLFGCDGYGTVVCKNKKGFEKFKKENSKNLPDWICEDFIAFKRELAFSIARNKQNKFCILPLVETFQKDSKCFWVKGPEESNKLNALISKVKKMLDSIDYVGIIAFELFETREGKLLVNEVAPRVHNSGHYSIEALDISQFDLHILSVFNDNLNYQAKAKTPFAMVNLIGSSTKSPKLKWPKNGSLHWYSKTNNRAGRKMGHITVLDKNANTALKSALKEEKGQFL